MILYIQLLRNPISYEKHEEMTAAYSPIIFLEDGLEFLVEIPIWGVNLIKRREHRWFSLPLF